MFEQAVTETEELCRYVMDKNYFRISDLGVKPNAFMPPKGGKLSVYRIDGLTSHEVLDIGIKFVAELRGKKLLGCGNVRAAVPLANGLCIAGTEKPHPRHANISNWPGGTEDRLIAIKIAAAAKLELLPPPVAGVLNGE